MKITNIEIIPLKIPAPPREHMLHSVNPIHRFADLRYDAPAKKRDDTFNTLVVQVNADQSHFYQLTIHSQFDGIAVYDSAD
jgi:hypothetical protein